MRKVLNVLESCSLNYKEISQATVYEVTGRPSPSDVTEIFRSLTNDKFNQGVNIITDLINKKSLALDDIISELHISLMSTKLDNNRKMYLVKRMAEIEHRLAQGCNEKVQIAALVGAFFLARTFKGEL